MQKNKSQKKYRQTEKQVSDQARLLRLIIGREKMNVLISRKSATVSCRETDIKSMNTTQKTMTQKTMTQKTMTQKTKTQKTMTQKTMTQKTMTQKTMTQKTMTQKTKHRSNYHRKINSRPFLTPTGRKNVYGAPSDFSGDI
jgi:hypothetical protein